MLHEFTGAFHLSEGWVLGWEELLRHFSPFLIVRQLLVILCKNFAFSESTSALPVTCCGANCFAWPAPERRRWSEVITNGWLRFSLSRSFHKRGGEDECAKARTKWIKEEQGRGFATIEKELGLLKQMANQDWAVLKIYPLGKPQ